MAIQLYLPIKRFELLKSWPANEYGLVGLIVAQRVLNKDEQALVRTAADVHARILLRELLNARSGDEYFASFIISTSQHKAEATAALNDICEKHPDVIAITAFSKLRDVYLRRYHLNSANYDQVFIVNWRANYALPEAVDAAYIAGQSVAMLKGRPSILLNDNEVTENHQTQAHAAEELEKEFKKYYELRKNMSAEQNNADALRT